MKYRFKKNSLVLNFDKKPKAQREMSEAELHSWICDYLKKHHPKVKFNTDMSGVRLPMGLSKKVARLRSERGYPDILIFESCGNYSGLFIEVKAPDATVIKKDGTISQEKHIQEQARVIRELRERWYFTDFVQTKQEATDLIEWYLGLFTQARKTQPYPKLKYKQ